MLKNLVTKSAFSRRAGVAIATTVKNLKGKLSEALVNGKIDLDHPIAIEYLRKHAVRASTELKSNDNQDVHEHVHAEKNPTKLDYADHINKLADMSLRDLIRNYGTDCQFYDWLKALKIIEDIETKQLTNSTTKSDLISRDIVKLTVLDNVETAHRRLLTDGAKAMAVRTKALCDSGSEVIEIEQYLSSAISKFIKNLKKKMIKHIKSNRS